MTSPTVGTRNFNMFVKDGALTAKPLTWIADDGNRPTDEWLAEDGYFGYISVDPPSFDRKLERVEEVPLRFLSPVDGVVTQEWTIVSLTPEEVAAAESREWVTLRETRDDLLAKSDWTQVLDTPVDKEVWATYRQALRDLPNNTEDPFNPVWPVKPE